MWRGGGACTARGGVGETLLSRRSRPTSAPGRCKHPLTTSTQLPPLLIPRSGLKYPDIWIITVAPIFQIGEPLYCLVALFAYPLNALHEFKIRM